MQLILGRQPVVIAAAIRAVILAAVGFGFRLEPEQIAALMLAVEAILAVIVQPSVTPVAAPSLAVGTPVTVERAEGQPKDTPPPDAVVALRSDLK